jgi:membrane associated rhomboid family serine protease
MGMVVPVIDNGGHVGGFIAGLALAWVVPPKKVKE